jgi:hypothetical protein
MTRIGRHYKEWAAEHHGQDKLVAIWLKIASIQFVLSRIIKPFRGPC